MALGTRLGGIKLSEIKFPWQVSISVSLMLCDKTQEQTLFMLDKFILFRNYH